MSSQQPIPAAEQVMLVPPGAQAGAVEVTMPGGAKLIRVRQPIFKACTRFNEQTKKQETFDEQWLREAAENANALIDKPGGPFAYPIVIRHSDDPRGPGQHAGFMGRQVVEKDHDGVPTIFCEDYYHPEVYDLVKKGKLPYRSVEIYDPSKKIINKLSLLDNEPSFFKFGIEGMQFRDDRAAETHALLFRDEQGHATLAVVQRFADDKKRKPKGESEAERDERDDAEDMDDAADFGNFGGPDDDEFGADEFAHPGDLDFDPMADPTAADDEFPLDEDESGLLGGDGYDPMLDDGMMGDPMSQYATKDDFNKLQQAVQQIADRLGSAPSAPTSPAPVIADERRGLNGNAPVIQRMASAYKAQKKRGDDLEAKLVEQDKKIADLIKFRDEQAAAASKFAEQRKAAADDERIADVIDDKLKPAILALHASGIRMDKAQAQYFYETAFTNVSSKFAESGKEDEIEKHVSAEVTRIREILAPGFTEEDRAARAGSLSFAEPGGVKPTGVAFIDKHKDDAEKHGRAKRASAYFREHVAPTGEAGTLTEAEFVEMAVSDPSLIG